MRNSFHPLTLNRRALAAVSIGVVLALAAQSGEAGVAAAVGKSVTTTAPGWSVTLSVAKVSVRAGHTVPATLTITNKTHHSAKVYSCAANGVYGIKIENARIPEHPITGLVGCSSTLRPGRNVFHKRIRAIYESCSENNPPCPAPLPAGVYHTVLNWPTFSAHVPKPGVLTITVTH